jgi:plasmid stabilization system protein ParE
VSVSLILNEKAEEVLMMLTIGMKKRNLGWARRLFDVLMSKFANINRHPFHHQIVQNENVRRALVNRFPFSIYFEIEEELITIFAILHQSRNPDYWRSRI